MSRNTSTTGAYAEFFDDESARRAVQVLTDRGIPRSRILVSEHAPDQSSTPINTQERDKRTVSRMGSLGVRGALIGLVAGAIFGAVLGSLVWSPMTPAWFLLAVGLGVFGFGLGILLSFMIGKGEAEHMGTVYDRPAADQPTMITVRADDPGEVDNLLEVLESAGGRKPRPMPRSANVPER